MNDNLALQQLVRDIGSESTAVALAAFLRDLDALREQVVQTPCPSASSLFNAAHKVKSAAHLFGFSTLGHHAGRLEQCCRQSDTTAIQQQAQKLCQTIDHQRPCIEQHLDAVIHSDVP